MRTNIRPQFMELSGPLSPSRRGSPDRGGRFALKDRLGLKEFQSKPFKSGARLRAFLEDKCYFRGGTLSLKESSDVLCYRDRMNEA